jgi:hypothetical protein
MAGDSPDGVVVPDVVGLQVHHARLAVASVDLFLTTRDPDGPPIGAFSSFDGWYVIAQVPAPGAVVPRASWIAVEIEERGGGGESGDREPRIPASPAGVRPLERSFSGGWSSG